MRRPIAKFAVSSGAWALVPITLCAAPAENSSTSMETVVVQGQKLNVETKIDRKIYTVPEDAQSTLGTLSDILNVIPSVDVDPDGNVSLRAQCWACVAISPILPSGNLNSPILNSANNLSASTVWPAERTTSFQGELAEQGLHPGLLGQESLRAGIDLSEQPEENRLEADVNAGAASDERVHVERDPADGQRA